ncbi:hypothetical protein KQX54_011144 [Cotesia glomerata]|uniref:Secreted protein n=1 Tax=Cotesia glomerata TaxID=32391 RepID=A0AAV7IQX0_COTGL|nr:hypothetical protein KQX54_011144 [Cotesia glomerata]
MVIEGLILITCVRSVACQGCTQLASSHLEFIKIKFTSNSLSAVQYWSLVLLTENIQREPPKDLTDKSRIGSNKSTSLTEELWLTRGVEVRASPRRASDQQPRQERRQPTRVFIAQAQRRQEWG